MNTEPIDKLPSEPIEINLPEHKVPEPLIAEQPLKPVFAIDDIVSGRFDEEQSDENLAPPTKRVLAPEPESPKLHKILAQAGLGSRLEMEQMIVEGRITVNKEPAHIGMRIQYGDQITVNGKPIKVRIDPPPARVLAYHKPAGEVVTHDDPQNRPTVFRRLPKLHQGKWQSVGRLDLNTEGLLLFTSSGELANRLTHPRFGLEREYAVRILGALSNEEKQKLLDGVMLDDGLAQFGSIEDGGGEGANCWYRVTISEGRNREVRRMIESLGHAVSRLIRIRYGSMLLPKGLKRGFWMELDDADLRALQSVAGGGNEKPAGRDRQGRGNQRRDRNKQRGDRPIKQANPQANQLAQEGQRDEAEDFNQERIPNGINPERTMMDFKRQTFGNGGGSGGGKSRNRNRGSGSGQSGLGGGASSGHPDPMRTSFGYIGGDSLQRQRSESNGNSRRTGNRGGRGRTR